jgi:hypothetical protein
VLEVVEVVRAAKVVTVVVVVVVVVVVATAPCRSRMPTSATNLCTKCADRTMISTRSLGKSSEASSVYLEGELFVCCLIFGPSSGRCSICRRFFFSPNHIYALGVLLLV